MKKLAYHLCEIIFKDHKTGILTSRIGKIDEYQLTDFSTNSKDFIIFNESYNSPVLKEDIKEIVIHRNKEKLPIKEVNTINIKYLKTQKTGEIS